MTYFTPSQLEKLFENGLHDNRGKDHCPVALAFFPLTSDIRHHYLLTELYKDRPYIGYGLSCVAGRRPVIQEIVISFLLNNDDIAFGTRNGGVVFDAKFNGLYPLSHYLRICNEHAYLHYKGDDEKLEIPYIDYYSNSIYPLSKDISSFDLK